MNDDQQSSFIPELAGFHLFPRAAGDAYRATWDKSVVMRTRPLHE